jgi:ABC-2 type transport system ATP-binding protein
MEAALPQAALSQTGLSQTGPSQTDLSHVVPSQAGPPPTVLSAEPVIEAAGVGVETHRGRVYSGFGLRANAGQVVAIAGRGGSGRTSVLLTLGGRMRASEGKLRVCGQVLPDAAARVRALTSVARIGGAAELEPGLRVADHVRERALAERVPPAKGTIAFNAARDVVRADLPLRHLVRELAPWQVTAFALTLALMESRQLILLDDLDAGADEDTQAWLWKAARRVAATGPCVVATTTVSGPAEGVADQVVAL